MAFSPLFLQNMANFKSCVQMKTKDFHFPLPIYYFMRFSTDV